MQILIFNKTIPTDLLKKATEPIVGQRYEEVQIESALAKMKQNEHLKR